MIGAILLLEKNSKKEKEKDHKKINLFFTALKN